MTDREMQNMMCKLTSQQFHALWDAITQYVDNTEEERELCQYEKTWTQEQEQRFQAAEAMRDACDAVMVRVAG
jgi:hypothetical protein